MFIKKKNGSLCAAKTKALISFAVTAKLICALGFAYANCWFSYAAAQMSLVFKLTEPSDICSLVH